MKSSPNPPSSVSRRTFLSGLTGAAAWTASGLARAAQTESKPNPTGGRPVLVGSANALPGMQRHYEALVKGAAPLDVAIEVVKIVEADPADSSVGLGGRPNEDGVVQLDAAVMHGPTHNSGAVACIENILHPSEVARLVMERTDHCLIVGPGAYEFARMHGHPHTELLTESSRAKWLEWRESMSKRDDRLPPPTSKAPGEKQKSGQLETGERAKVAVKEHLPEDERTTGTIHCSALGANGEIACTTTTSGLAWKIPGRVGDSPIIGAGLYCDQEAGSAGATGRGEAAILSNGSFAIVELLRQGKSPVDAGLEVLGRIHRQAKRAAAWQPDLVAEDGRPNFGIHFYVLGLDGSFAGVTLKGNARFAVADPEGGPRHEELVSLLE